MPRNTSIRMSVVELLAFVVLTFGIAVLILLLIASRGAVRSDPISLMPPGNSGGAPGSVSAWAWEPDSEQWVSANARGYLEGQSAAMAIEVGNAGGNSYSLDFCLQTTNSPFTDAYGFASFAPWNVSVLPPSLPEGPELDGAYGQGWSVTHPYVWGYNISIDAVTEPDGGDLTDAESSIQCGENFIGIRVDFTVLEDDDAYIVWGGRFAADDDPLLAGFPDVLVPANEGASEMETTIQSLIIGSDETSITFHANDVADDPILSLEKTAATASGSCPGTPTLSVPAGAFVNYCFDIRNGGLDPIYDLLLIDEALGGDITGQLEGDFIDANGDGVENDLAPGGSASTVIFSGPFSGSGSNTATAAGSGLSVQSTATVFVYALEIEVDKQISTDGETFEDGPIAFILPGQLWWRFRVRNVGQETVTLQLSDHLGDTEIDLDSVCQQPVPSTLSGGGGSYTCTFGPLQAQAGRISNVVRADACDVVYSDICAAERDSAGYEATALTLTLSKELSPSADGPWTTDIELLEGQEVHYRFVVENTSPVALDDVVVRDPLISEQPDDVVCDLGTLAAYDGVGVCTIAPVNVEFTGMENPWENTASVSGCYYGNICADDIASASYTGLYWSYPSDFWRQHQRSKGNAWLVTQYDPDDKLCDAFEYACSEGYASRTTTLNDALGFPKDAPPARQLLREGVASLLNASFHETQHDSIFGPNGEVLFPMYTTYESCVEHGGGLEYCADHNVEGIVNSGLEQQDDKTGLEHGQDMLDLAQDLRAVNWGLDPEPQ